jgi:hypothetical protein
MHKNATKCNKTQSKWCINKHGASKIIDMFETYQARFGLSEASRRRSKAISQAMDRVWASPASHQTLDATDLMK